MFVCSLKASTIKFFGIVGISIITLVALIFLVPSSSGATTQEIAAMNENISFNNVKSVDDGINFLRQYGWEVKKDNVVECEINIPKEFDKVMTKYNELQKEQGLNLEKYAKKTATRYTYEITNYPNYDGIVYANVITFRGKVIGGDICTKDQDGFLHTFYMPKSAE